MIPCRLSRAGTLAIIFSAVLIREPRVAVATIEQDAPLPKACELSAFAALRLEGARILSAQAVAAGRFTPPQAQAPLSGLPAFCRIRAVATPSSDSLINFEVWVPGPSTWNGKLVATGNGGYGNMLSFRDMSYALRHGYATLGGDTGHQSSTSDDLLWGFKHPEKIVDWGQRSIHAITVPAKQIVAALQVRTVRRAYFYGCSTGGHQAYAEMQRYPGDFDGLIAGAPGNNRVRLNVGFLWQFLSNHRPNDNATPIIPASKLAAITRAAVAACDANDGVKDDVVDDPRSCRFDPATIQCRPAPTPDRAAERGDASCLTGDQVAALNKMYAGPKNPRTGTQLYPGWPPTSEALTLGPGGAVTSGWQQYWGTTEPTRANFWRYWVFENPQWNWWTFDFDRDLATAEAKVGVLVDQVGANLSAFKARGGKAIVYHGWQDPVVNPIDTISYYEKLVELQGSLDETATFFRLFLVPGLGHCSGATGATNFGNPNAPPPKVDADHDLLSALDRWVETGTAPDRIVASRIVNGAVVRSRPLCPYPRKAVYRGQGSTDDAANFACR
jgi:feruloyl esterase